MTRRLSIAPLPLIYLAAFASAPGQIITATIAVFVLGFVALIGLGLARDVLR